MRSQRCVVILQVTIILACAAPSIVSPTSTIEPTLDACSWNWDRTELPEPTRQWQEALESADVSFGEAYVYGYADACLEPDPVAPEEYPADEIHLVARIRVDSIDDANSLGNIAEKTLEIVEAFPDDFPGHRVPMIIQITFVSPNEEPKGLAFDVDRDFQQWHGAELYQILTTPHAGAHSPAAPAVEFVQLGRSNPDHKPGGVAFNPQNNHQLASAGWGEVILWDTNADRRLRTFGGFRGWVSGIAFNPDGSILASGGQDASVRLWDVKTGQLLHESRAQTWVNSVAFSPDGQIVAAGTREAFVRLWDVRTGESLRILKGDTCSATSVAFNHDGTLIASGSCDNRVRVWDVATGDLLYILEGHTEGVWGVAFSSRFNLLASTSRDSTVRLWNLDTPGNPAFSILEGHSSAVETLAFSPDGGTLATGGWDGTIRLWEAQNGSLLGVLKSDDQCIGGVAFGPDGQSLASSATSVTHDNDKLFLWKVKW